VPTSAEFIGSSDVSIGHPGIVAGAFDSLGIAGVVDRAIPKTRQHHLTHGDIGRAVVLCLFMYSMTEFRLRRKLQETGETVTGQTKKQTENPTLKWLFFRFRRVRELRFRAGKAVTVLGTNVTPEFWKILRLLGRGM